MLIGQLDFFLFLNFDAVSHFAVHLVFIQHEHNFFFCGTGLWMTVDSALEGFRDGVQRKM